MKPGCDIVIVGLGNPTQEYSQHRHNLGWMVLDSIYTRHNGLSTGWLAWEQGLVCTGKRNERTLLLLKPTTWMNSSGDALGEITACMEVDPSHVIVVHDELDVPFAEVRTKFGGGTAGHRGLASVVSCLGTKDFHRVRCGIGRPQNGRTVLEHVLSGFESAELESLSGMIEEAIHRTYAIIDEIVTKG